MAVFLEFDKVKTVKIPEGNVKKISIGGQLLWQYRYTWAKYVSKRVSSSYENYKTESANLSVRIWKPEAYEDLVVLIGEYPSGSGGVEYSYSIYFYSNMSYSKSTGTFTLSGEDSMVLTTGIGLSNYTIESKLIGKYVKVNGKIYKITGHNDVYSLYLQETYTRGSVYYTYSYSYVEDVKNVNPNAYSSGSTGNYTSYSSNDIRTVYVSKG